MLEKLLYTSPIIALGLLLLWAWVLRPGLKRAAARRAAKAAEHAAAEAVDTKKAQEEGERRQIRYRQEREEQFARLHTFGECNKSLLGVRSGVVMVPTFRLIDNSTMYGGFNGSGVPYGWSVDQNTHQLTSIRLSDIQTVNMYSYGNGREIAALIITKSSGRYSTTITVEVHKDHLDFAMNKVLS